MFTPFISDISDNTEVVGEVAEFFNYDNFTTDDRVNTISSF